jgi:hypothetical protein
MNEFRKLIILSEGRNPEIEYDVSAKAVTAKLKSYNSAIYTNLAKKVQKIDALEQEVKALKEEVKTEAKSHVADLFDATDAVHTRVVETISFILTLSKDPKPTETVKYAKVLEDLTTHLTPELIAVLEQLKKQYTSEAQKSPTLSVKAKSNELSEGIMSDAVNKFTAFLHHVLNWGKKYDQKLNQLKRMV